jgi:hypothetical protein
MNSIIVSRMIGKISPFEFNGMFNQSQHFFSVLSERSFFDVHIFNDMLLVYEVQHFCKSVGERYDLDLILDIVQRRLDKSAILLRMRKDEGMCENIYHYVFLLK